jgi:hypothetical protein
MKDFFILSATFAYTMSLLVALTASPKHIMNHPNRIFAIVLIGLFLAPTWTIHAAPAAYYLWMSMLDGSRVCSQTPMGEGWKLMGGPYKDSRCQKPA